MACLTLLLLAATIGAQAPRHDLSLRLKVGESWSGTLKQEFREIGETEIAQEFTYRIETKVVGLAGDGYRLQESVLLTRHLVDGDPLPAAPGEKPIVSSLLVSKQGERADVMRGLEDPAEFRLERLVWFLAPNRGDRIIDGTNLVWARILPGNEGGTVPEARAEWKLARTADLDGKRAAWVQFSLEEVRAAKPMHASGTFVVDLETGVPIVATIRARGAQIPGGEGEIMDLTVEWKRA